MKNRNQYIILSTIILIGLYFFLNHTPDSPQEKTALDKKVTTSATIEKRISIKSTRYTENKKLIAKTFPKECSKAFIDLNRLIPEEYMSIIDSRASVQSFFSESCLSALKKNKTFNQLAKDSDCNILDQNFKFTEEKIKTSCSTLMFTLKAFSIAEQTQDVLISQMTSQELAANFIKMFFSFDKLNKEVLDQNKNLLDQFYEMHKDDPSVVEAYLGYIMIGQQITEQQQYNPQIDKILKDHKGESFKVDRLAAIKEVLNSDMSKAKETLDKLSTDYSKEAELQYYYAAYYWKQNNRSMANTYLDKAISMSKNCSFCAPSMYKGTKERMKEAQYGDKTLFAISVGLNFEDL